MRRHRDVDILFQWYGLNNSIFMLGNVLYLTLNLERSEAQHQVDFDSVNNVSNISLDCDVCYSCVEGVKNSLFCGIGGDRTVGVNKTAVLIIGDHTDHNSQC